MSEFGAEDMADGGPVLGIDLGTTYSCVAVFDKNLGEVVVLANSEGARTTPSYVAFTDEGRIVGQAAKAQVASNAKGTVFDVKRILGRTFEDHTLQEEAKRMPFGVVDGGAKRPLVEVTWRGKQCQFAPEEVSAMVLGEMVDIAAARMGMSANPPKRAVITVPAHFNDQQRQATKDAGRIAGLEVLRIINEPTAAALAYGLHDLAADLDEEEDESKAEARHKRMSRVLIFDLGGGTFDVSVLCMEDGVFAVQATGGDTHLGGEDFDNVMVDHLVDAYARKHAGADKLGETVAAGGSKKGGVKKNSGKGGVAGSAAATKALNHRIVQNSAELRKNERAMRRLQQAAEKAKRELSMADSAEVEVPSLIKEFDLELTIQRSEFEAMCETLFERCLTTVAEVVKDAACTMEEISECVLVGGSTRIPKLQQMLHSAFGGRLELCKSVHPDEAVAVGAAVQGAILRAGQTGGGADLAPAGCQDLVLLDVTPLSLGIELEGGQMSTLIKRSTPIPCAKTREYTTVEDFQTCIDVCVYEGERPHVSGNNKLGEFQIDGVERARKGEPKVEVTFALDADGILSVTARDKVTDAKASTKIKADRGRLDDADIERMIADAAKYRQGDQAFAAKAKLRNGLEQAARDAKKTCGSGLKDAEKKAALDDLLEWLEYDGEDAAMDTLTERANRLKLDYNINVAADSQ